jgi:hypothetical protein
LRILDLIRGFPKTGVTKDGSGEEMETAGPSALRCSQVEAAIEAGSGYRVEKMKEAGS